MLKSEPIGIGCMKLKSKLNDERLRVRVKEADGEEREFSFPLGRGRVLALHRLRIGTPFRFCRDLTF